MVQQGINGSKNIRFRHLEIIYNYVIAKVGIFCNKKNATTFDTIYTQEEDMKNLIRGFFTILFMFVIPFLGIVSPVVITLGYFIDSLAIVSIIGTAIFWLFNGNALVIIVSFIASIIVPALYGDFDLMLISIIIIALYLTSPYLLGWINKNE